MLLTARFLFVMTWRWWWIVVGGTKMGVLREDERKVVHVGVFYDGWVVIGEQ